MINDRPVVHPLNQFLRFLLLQICVGTQHMSTMSISMQHTKYSSISIDTDSEGSFI